MGIEARILTRQRHEAENAQIVRTLREMVLTQVEAVNGAVGSPMLYANECAGHLFLFGNPGGGHIDRLMACVPLDIEGLMKVWFRLEKAVKEDEV